MTKAELIKLLADVPDDMPVTRIFEDFPTDFKSVEIIDATRPVLYNPDTTFFWYSEYFLQENGLTFDGVQPTKIAVLR